LLFIMKTNLLLLFFLAGLSAFAQKNNFPAIKQNAFKMNLLSPIFNTVNISYQRLVTPEKSLQVGFSYMNFNDFLDEEDRIDVDETNKITGYNVIAEYRVNFTGYGLNGFYAGPFLRYLNYTRDYKYSYYNSSPASVYKQTSKYQSMGLGFILGKQFLIKNIFTIDLFAGPVYQVLLENKQSRSGNMQNSSYYSRYDAGAYLGQVIPNNYLKGYSLRAGFNIGLAF
jgi:hypothetical protein